MKKLLLLPLLLSAHLLSGCAEIDAILAVADDVLAENVVVEQPKTTNPTRTTSTGNTSIDSFSRAKRLGLNQVYHDHRITIYCKATFDERGYKTLPPGFTTDRWQNRLHKIEWEHIVLLPFDAPWLKLRLSVMPSYKPYLSEISSRQIMRRPGDSVAQPGDSRFIRMFFSSHSCDLPHKLAS